MIQAKLKFQSEADPNWARQVSEHPGCEGLSSCLQCGACSGACPLSIYMDYSPRRIIALVREGFRKDALSSRTIWLCASCYSCSVQCPRGIHVTDIMYSLKREAIQNHLYPRRLPAPALAQEFFDMVRRRGRSSEFWLIVRTALRSNPLILLGMFRMGLGLARTGRFSLRRDQITNAADLGRKLARSEAVL